MTTPPDPRDSATSTTCASSCARSAISTPASIGSCSAPAHAHAPAGGDCAAGQPAHRRARRRAARARRRPSASPRACPASSPAPRDGFVVAAYLGALFGAASFVGESAAGAGGRCGRRRSGVIGRRSRGADRRRCLHDRLPRLSDALVGRLDVDDRGGRVAICRGRCCRSRSPRRSACCSDTWSPSPRSPSAWRATAAAPARRTACPARRAACWSRRAC